MHHQLGGFLFVLSCVYAVRACKNVEIKMICFGMQFIDLVGIFVYFNDFLLISQKQKRKYIFFNRLNFYSWKNISNEIPFEKVKQTSLFYYLFIFLRKTSGMTDGLLNRINELSYQNCYNVSGKKWKTTNSLCHCMLDIRHIFQATWKKINFHGSKNRRRFIYMLHMLFLLLFTIFFQHVVHGAHAPKRPLNMSQEFIYIWDSFVSNFPYAYNSECATSV